MDVKEDTRNAAHTNNNFFIKNYFKVIDDRIIPIGRGRINGN
jgi:hypothetical protein